MELYIKQCLYRTLSLLITFCLLLSLVGISSCPVSAAESTPKSVTLSLNSSETNRSEIDAYIYDSVYYISLDNLCTLTRSRWDWDGDIIKVHQGFWNSYFDIDKQQFYDGYQTVDIHILEYEKMEYAVPALMFLSYFKATAFIRDDTLYCRMPEFTAWEAFDIDYENTLIDIYELYGGEHSVEIALCQDILMDFLVGDMSSANGYINNAFLAALKVNPNDYSSVKSYAQSAQKDLYEDIHSDKGKKYIENIKYVLSFTAEPTQWVIHNFYNSNGPDFLGRIYNAYVAGRPAETQNYSKKLYELLEAEHSARADKFFDNADYLMLFISSAESTVQQMKYLYATNNLIYNVLGKENLDYLGLTVSDKVQWYTAANNSKNLIDVAATQLETQATQFFTDKASWDFLAGTVISSAAGISRGAWTFSLNAARLIAKEFPLTGSSIEAMQAECKALYLSELQQKVCWVTLHALKNIENKLDDPEAYVHCLQAAQLYCRVSIAMYENLITLAKEHSNNPDYFNNLFQEWIDSLAVSLYQLTALQEDGIHNCLPLKLASFKEPSVPSEENAVEFNGHYYYLYQASPAITWNEAQAFCEEKGGYLATITSAEEDDFLYSYVRRQGRKAAHFGMTDSELEGHWKWVTGEAFTYSNWPKDQPDGQKNENYGMYFREYQDFDQGLWNDGPHHCDTFLCEWGPYNIASSDEEQYWIAPERPDPDSHTDQPDTPGHDSSTSEPASLLLGEWFQEDTWSVVYFFEDGTTQAPFTFEGGYIESASHYGLKDDGTLILSSTGGHVNRAYSHVSTSDEAFSDSMTYYISDGTLIIDGSRYVRISGPGSSVRQNREIAAPLFGQWYSEENHETIMYREDSECQVPFLFDGAWIEAASYYSIRKDGTLIVSSPHGHIKRAYTKVRSADEALRNEGSYFVSGDTLIIQERTYEKLR